MLTNNPHGFQNSCFWDWPIRFLQDDCYCDENIFPETQKLQPRTINYPSISILTKRTSERNCYRNCATLISKVPTISFMISLFYLSLDQHHYHFVNRNTYGKIIWKKESCLLKELQNCILCIIRVWPFQCGTAWKDGVISGPYLDTSRSAGLYNLHFEFSIFREYNQSCAL